MAESIVKVPDDKYADYDFIAFSFNGKHSYEDFGIYRTSGGKDYTENLTPVMQDITATVPGADGTFYFGTNYTKRDFNISFAFDNMTESKLAEMRNWLRGDAPHDLWFAEAPYKVYSAKVVGTPNLQYIPFDRDLPTIISISEENLADNGISVDSIKEIYLDSVTMQVPGDAQDEYQSEDLHEDIEEHQTHLTNKFVKYYYTVQECATEEGELKSWQVFYDWTGDEDGEQQVEFIFGIVSLDDTVTFIPISYYLYQQKTVVYKGTGSVQLTAFYPFAHSPDWVSYDGEVRDGKEPASYIYFSQYGAWRNKISPDLPSTFVLTNPGNYTQENQNGSYYEGQMSVIGYTEQCEITILPIKTPCKNITWDSKTGIVSAELQQKDGTYLKQTIPYTGTSCVSLLGKLECSVDGELVGYPSKLKYNYWYH